MNQPQGAMTALITPFKNQKLDVECYEKLIQRQIDNGIEVVVPVGTTGESATLSHTEHQECVEIAVAVCKGTGVKVLAGAGSNSTNEAISLSLHAQHTGADGILVVTPYYNKPTQQGLFEHYKEVANSVEIPLLLYNVPSRTGVDLEANTAIRLFNECKNIYGIKEATGSIARVVELNAKEPKLTIISGDDGINYPILASGGKGVISVTSNLLPNEISNLVKFAREGNFDKSREINNRLYEINRALFLESNPLPIKGAMYIAGLMKSLEYRLPLVAPSKETMKKLENIINKLQIV